MANRKLFTRFGRFRILMRCNKLKAQSSIELYTYRMKNCYKMCKMDCLVFEHILFHLFHVHMYLMIVFKRDPQIVSFFQHQQFLQCMNDVTKPFEALIILATLVPKSPVIKCFIAINKDNVCCCFLLLTQMYI